MLLTEVQRSVRLNKKEKSTNTSPYPDEVIERLARAFYPAILACWNSEEGQREFAAWQAEQAHISGKEKQEVPVGELPALLIACGFLQGASGWARPVFVAFNPYEIILLTLNCSNKLFSIFLVFHSANPTMIQLLLDISSSYSCRKAHP